MKIGDLVRVQDSDAVNVTWRGQLAIIIGPGEIDTPNRFEIKRLHDGATGYTNKYVLEEAPNEEDR